MPAAILSGLVDLRETDSADYPNAMLRALDALQPGEAFVLVAGADPWVLLDLLETNRKGLFEWSPLEQGAAVWRVQVTRRPASSGSLREVTEALAWDHDRLEEVEDAAFGARATGDMDEARRSFAEFAHGLRRHIRFEEQILFPAFEERSGLPTSSGPTAVMRDEHREIEALLDAIAEGIADPASGVLQLRAALHRVLGAHNLKEEQVLYPSTDRLLSPAERDELVRRIQAFRP